MPHRLQLAASNREFRANAADFDGTNDSLERGGGLTGVVDAGTGILALWGHFNGGDTTEQILFDTPGGTVRCIRTLVAATNFLSIVLAGGAFTTHFRTTTAINIATGWFSMLAAWDNNIVINKIRHLYINDVSDIAFIGGSDDAFLVDYTQTNWGVGARVGGVSRMNGCLSEVYFAPGQLLDFSITANRRKFIDAAGKPVPLGSNGSNPTGTAPAIYLNNSAAGFQFNKGTGGNFTTVGTLTNCATSPSD